MLGYLCVDIICFENRTVFLQQRSENRKLLGTDYVQGQISKQIFTPNGGYCVCYFLQHVQLENITQIFNHGRHLDQSRTNDI